jgi:RecB family exonuclease
VLGLSDRDDPEHIEDISPLDRGSLVHRILERFIADAIAAGSPAPDAPWSPLERQRLSEIANEEFASVEARGRTGRPLHWQVQRDDLLVVLDAFLDADDAFRAQHRSTPQAVELQFGLEGSPPVVFTLADGRTISLRGLADRVDTSSDGRAIVIDYKSGRGTKYDGIEKDPVLAGTSLQLGLYAEAAMRHTGLDRSWAAFWVVEAAWGKQLRGYDWTPEIRDRFLDVLGAIAAGVESGMFAASPGEWDTFRQTNEACVFCEFDRVCVRDRGEQSVAKESAPELAIRSRLLAPDPAASA